MKTATLKDIQKLFNEDEINIFPITIIQTIGEENFKVTYTQVNTEIEGGNKTPLKILENITTANGGITSFYANGAALNFDIENNTLELYNAYAPVSIFIEAIQGLL